MSAIEFVQQLLDTGRVRVGASSKLPDNLGRAVAQLDGRARTELAFEPPRLSVDAGEWGLLILYRGCQALVHREIEGPAVQAALATPCPVPPSPEVCYSVDLSLQFLPELIGLARGIAEQDPLVEGLRMLAAAWPLSSVGIKGLPAERDITPFFGHPTLRRLYTDRIIARSDLSRLNDLSAREAIRASLGGFPELAPHLATALLAEENRTCP